MKPHNMSKSAVSHTNIEGGSTLQVAAPKSKITGALGLHPASVGKHQGDHLVNEKVTSHHRK